MAGESWKSIRDLTRKRLLVDMIQASRPKKGGNEAAYLVLVLDKRTTKVLSSALRMYDVTEAGLALVESLEKSRQPFPELEVVYFIEPTAESIGRVVADFSDAKQPRYGEVHLFFSRHVEDAELAPIQACKPLLSRIQTFTEVNLDFMAVESHAFHFDMPDAAFALYNELGEGKEACKRQIVDRLVTLCATLNEYPYVRYQSGNALSTELANAFQESVNKFVTSNDNFWFRGDGKPGHGDQSLRGTLLVLDRAVDPAAPLLHEFSYQAMVYDLLDITGNRVDYTIESEGGGERVAHALLNEHDALWVQFRHMHIAEVIQEVSQHLKEYLATSVGKIQAGRGGELDLQGMTEAVKQLPAYRAMMQKHNMHLQLTSSCMDKLEKRKVLQCAELEQLMVTGVNKDAHEVSASALTTQVLQLVQDPGVGAEETLRLLAIYVITQRGIKSEDRQRIMKSAQPPVGTDAQNAIINLSHLGVTMETGTKKQKTRRQKELLEKAKRMALNCDYSVARYVPAIQEVTEQLCTHDLEKDLYPYIYEPPPLATQPSRTSSGATTGRGLSVRKHGLGPVKSLSKFGASWGAVGRDSSSPTEARGSGAATKSERKQFDGGRLIVFVAGGATYSELRAIHEVMKEHNREVIIGATHFLRPRAFVDVLGRLDAEWPARRAGGAAPAGGGEVELTDIKLDS